MQNLHSDALRNKFYQIGYKIFGIVQKITLENANL